MTTVTSIIKQAYRESNLIAIAASPTVAQQEEALSLLNRFVLSLLDREFFETAENAATWGAVTPLTLGGIVPFSDKFDDLLIIGLAMRLNPRHGIMVDQQSIDTYKKSMRMFKADYRLKVQMDSEEGLLRGGANRWVNETDFNSGSN